MSLEKFISLTFIDGCFVADQSDAALLPEDVLFCPLNVVANGLQGAFLYVPPNCTVEYPILFTFKSSGEQAVYLRNTIVMKENSKATIIEEYREAQEDADYKEGKAARLATNNENNQAMRMPDALRETTASDFFLNKWTRSEAKSRHGITCSVTEVEVGKHATLHYYKLQAENATTAHSVNVLVQQQESSQTTLFFADGGAQTAQANLRVNLHEKYATCDLKGLYWLHRDDQEINNTVHIDHAAEYGVSSIQFKGILDKNSRAGFVGKVYVHEKAQHSQARQANHNLLLSANAQVSTKPELEIYADDIKCSHGATVGQLDDESLFYLRSRGIEKNAALQLLTQAFAEDIMNQIEPAAIRRYIQEGMNSYEKL